MSVCVLSPGISVWVDSCLQAVWAQSRPLNTNPAAAGRSRLPWTEWAEDSDEWGRRSRRRRGQVLKWVRVCWWGRKLPPSLHILLCKHTNTHTPWFSWVWFAVLAWCWGINTHTHTHTHKHTHTHTPLLTHTYTPNTPQRTDTHTHLTPSPYEPGTVSIGMATPIDALCPTERVHTRPSEGPLRRGLWEIWFMMPVVLLTSNFCSLSSSFPLSLHLSPAHTLCDLPA